MATPMRSLSDLMKIVEDNEEYARLLAYTFNLYHYSIIKERKALVAEDIYQIFSIFETLVKAKQMKAERRPENGGEGDRGDRGDTTLDATVITPRGRIRTETEEE